MITVEGTAETGVVYARPLRPYGADVLSDAPLRWVIGPNGYLQGDDNSTVIEVPSGQYRLDFNLRAGWVRSQQVNVPEGGTQDNPINIAGLLGVEDNHPPTWTLTQNDVLAILTARDETLESEGRVRLLVAQVRSIEEQVAEVAALTDRAETAATTAEDALPTILEAVSQAQASASNAGQAQNVAEGYAATAEASAERAETGATTATSGADRAETARDTTLTAETRINAAVQRAEDAAARAEAAADRAENQPEEPTDG